jgi:hypothetical protein
LRSVVYYYVRPPKNKWTNVRLILIIKLKPRLKR